MVIFTHTQKKIFRCYLLPTYDFEYDTCRSRYTFCLLLTFKLHENPQFRKKCRRCDLHMIPSWNSLITKSTLFADTHSMLNQTNKYKCLKILWYYWFVYLDFHDLILQPTDLDRRCCYKACNYVNPATLNFILIIKSLIVSRTFEENLRLIL